MRQKWYGDNRDLVKWGTLVHLAQKYKLRRILQIAFLRSDTFPGLRLDGVNYRLPKSVLDHFRDIRRITSMRGTVPISVLDVEFDDRSTYLERVLAFIRSYKSEQCGVFLDPDTGLEPLRRPDLTHVLDCEASIIWGAMKSGDVFAFYQHQTNRAGRPWKEAKRLQLASALNIDKSSLKIAEAAKGLPRDVVIFFARR